MRVAWGWLWGGFGVALESQLVAYRLPTKWLWGGFEVALYSGVYAEYMPTIWLYDGFEWLARPPRNRPVPGTTSYSSDNSCAADDITYSDSEPAQAIEIKHLVQSAQFTPVIGFRCR
jgi:hypothetical protein